MLVLSPVFLRENENHLQDCLNLAMIDDNDKKEDGVVINKNWIYTE